MGEILNIGGRLHSTETGNVVAGANEILDDTKGKKQSQVNAETDITLENHQQQLNDKYNKNEVYSKSETYNKNEVFSKEETYDKEALNSLITTPEVDYVTLTAEDGDTLEDIFDGVEGASDTIYRVGSWDGTQYDTTKYTEYGFNGIDFIQLDVKEIGVDTEPTAGSHNLVESGGVNISYKVNAVSGSDFIYNLPIKFKQGQKYSIVVSCDTANVFQGNTIVLCKTDNTGVIELTVNGGYVIYTHELADNTPLRLYRYRSNVLANAVVEVEIDKNYHAGKEINALATNLALLDTNVSDNTAELVRINNRTGLILEKNSVSANGTVFTNSNVAVGDIVYLTFKVGASGVGAIGYFNSNDERIEYYGLGSSSASPNAKLSYKTIIPQGFAYAKVQWYDITNVFVEKQLIQEKDLQGQIDTIASTTSTGAISTVQGQTIDYLTDIVFEQGKTYSIALKSSVDGIINQNFLVLLEKISNPTVNVSISLNGEHVIYTHSIYNTKMHLYRYGSNVLASGSIKLEIKRDVFDSEDIDTIKNNVVELQSFNKVQQFSTTTGSDFYPQIPFSFKKGTTYAIRLISPISEIIKGNKVNLTDNKDNPTVSEDIYINGNALIYTHTLDTPTMYLSRYRTNVLVTGIIEMSIQKEYLTDKTINDLQDKEIQLKAIAEYNVADYDRINSQEKVLLLGSERTSSKNKTKVNACSGSYNKVKFAICTDIHVNANENQKYHWWNPDTGQFDFTGIERAFGYMDSRKYDFLISLGDNINDGYMGTYALMVSEKNSLDSILKDKATDTIFFFLSGNHDTHINVPRFTGNGVFSVRGVNFISFYATYITLSQDPTVAGGIVSDETLQWLDDVLTEHEGEINIVMCHFPLGDGNLNYAILDSYTTAGGETGDGHRDDVIQILESHNVHLYLSGHCHAQTWPIYQLGTNLKEINCGSLTSNVNTILLGGSFAIAEIDAVTKKFNGVVYGVDTLEPRTHEIISGNNDPISDLTNIDV